MKVVEKLAALRSAMQKNNLDAFIVFSADPHLSEYLPEEWLERPWLTGFTGSAGFVVITKDKAALWTDSRYFVQGEMELKDSTIELMKDGLDNTPNYVDWLKLNLESGAKVGVNALVTSHNQWKELQTKLSTKNIELKNVPLLDKVWSERKAVSQNPIFVHQAKWAGKSILHKIDEIKKKLNSQEANAHIITSLDDVAWTTNLRGSDVDYNPVFLGYIYLDEDKTTLFVDASKLNQEAIQNLKDNKIEVLPYAEFYTFLEKLKDKKILISPNSNQAIFNAIEQNNTIIESSVPGNLMKATKNEVELDGFRTVMVRDGIAMVKFLYWLKFTGCKQNLSEFEIGQKLKEFRAEGENFVGESFGSIIGYQGNGAIVHYSAKEKDSKIVEANGSILVDSGGQYLEGTTDITRTFALGEVSEDFKKNCTLVLKGMIDLSMVKFPKGTRGVQLDAIARMPLWLESKDYGHGTGHGVGSFMNVHEGPANIRKDLNPQVLLPGMVLSNEPGFYVENEYGIRHENLVTVKYDSTTQFGDFYEFETLTICPFLVDSILPELLTAPQKKWLNNYHNWCEDMLAPHLEGEVKDWFLTIVKPI